MEISDICEDDIQVLHPMIAFSADKVRMGRVVTGRDNLQAVGIIQRSGRKRSCNSRMKMLV